MRIKQRTRRADKVQYSNVFVMPEAIEDWDDPVETARFNSEMTEYCEARQWLDQFYPCTATTIATGRKVLLIVGDESYVEQVWSCRRNHYKTKCYLEWERKEEPDGNAE